VSVAYSAGDDDAGDDGHEGEVGDPGLALNSHEIGEDGCEEGRRGADGLVERDGEVAQRDVPGDDGAAEDEAERSDLRELEAGAYELHGHDAKTGDGGIGEQGAGGHVTHGEEDGVLEAVVAEEVLVEQEHADVGGVPGGDEPHGEEAAGARRGPRAARRRRGAALGRHGSVVAAARIWLEGGAGVKLGMGGWVARRRWVFGREPAFMGGM
jgi:hypothetical protein